MSKFSFRVLSVKVWDWKSCLYFKGLNTTDKSFGRKDEKYFGKCTRCFCLIELYHRSFYSKFKTKDRSQIWQNSICIQGVLLTFFLL